MPSTLQLGNCTPSVIEKTKAVNKDAHRAHSFGLILIWVAALSIGWVPSRAAPSQRTVDKTKSNAIQSLTNDELVKEGHKKLAAGRAEEALLDAEKAIYIDNKSASAYFLRARAAHDIGLKREALKDYDKAIALNPRYTKALVNRALIKGGLGNFKAALSDLNAAIEIEPSFAAAYSNRGVTRGALNDRKGALKDFSKAISLNPSYADAYRNRGISKELMNDLKGACSDWKIAGSLGQKDAQTWYLQQCNL